MRLSDFDFSLPEKLIAQYPPADRSAGRLLDCVSADVADRLVRDLPQLLEAGDVLVFNDTKVIKARLAARKETGGLVEVMVERVIDQHQVLAMIKASHAPKIGSRLVIDDDVFFTVTDRADMLYTLACTNTIEEVLARFGALPLPPYIEHAPDANDEIRYQTVYARNPGAVAAPTAGLHFDEALLSALDARGVERVQLTLHVGAGTFLPVREDDLSLHVMHSEYFSIPPTVRSAIAKARSAKRRVVAVGTTSLRALEAAADGHGNVNPGEAQTQIFITPGYQFKVVDMLFTNFHLPKSTLLMLVSAFAGTERIRRTYSHAIESGYRFFSYGDAMLLERS